jgi:hypothetical protein
MNPRRRGTSAASLCSEDICSASFCSSNFFLFSFGSASFFLPCFFCSAVNPTVGMPDKLPCYWRSEQFPQRISIEGTYRCTCGGLLDLRRPESRVQDAFGRWNSRRGGCSLGRLKCGLVAAGLLRVDLLRAFSVVSNMWISGIAYVELTST